MKESIKRIYQLNNENISTVIETVNKDDHGASLVKNFRNVQPLSGREVTFYSSMEKIVAPMEPEIKSGSDEPVAEEETPSKRQDLMSSDLGNVLGGPREVSC